MVRFTTVAIFAAFAAASQAVVFNVVSVGTYTLVGSGYTTAENVVFQLTPSAVTTMAFNATYVGAGANGTIVYTGGGGSITLNFTSPGPFDFGGNSSAISGSWTFAFGTGAYAGYASGAGTFGATYNTTGNYASTTLSGDLQPVPEPASLAVIGLGVTALLRRRRKA